MTISPTITKTVGRSLLQIQKHSPLLLTIAGIGALVGAGILAAKSTLKLEETLDRGNDRLEHSRVTHEDGKATTAAYVQNVTEVAKLYAAPATLAVTGVVLVLSGHHILNKRNAALVVAYKGLETAFNNYRDRVKEKYGNAVDEEFRYGLRTNEIVGENGKKIKELTVGDAPGSEFLFDFGPGNLNWVGNYEHNLFFLRGHQNMLNDLLRARGHVFLSEALDALGIERTPASIVTGWIYDPRKELNDGVKRDDFIDFGIKDLWDSHGYILLDFNVEGTMFDKI